MKTQFRQLSWLLIAAMCAVSVATADEPDAPRQHDNPDAPKANTDNAVRPGWKIGRFTVYPDPRARFANPVDKSDPNPKSVEPRELLPLPASERDKAPSRPRSSRPDNGTPNGPEDGSETASLPELKLIPNSATAFSSIGVKEMLAKLGLTGRADKSPILAIWKREFGISLDQIERCTLVLEGSPARDEVMLIHTSSHVNREDVIKAFALGGKTVRHHDRECQVGGKDKSALCFVGDRLVVIGSSEAALANFLKEASNGPANDPGLVKALKRMGKHDVMAWGRAEALPPGGMPFTADIESGMILLDIGEEIVFDVEISCEEEDAADWAKKALQSGVDMARAQLLMVPAMIDMSRFMPSATGELSGLRFLPLKLMRQTEKALQRTVVKTEGTKVSLSVVIPVDAKALRSEISIFMRIAWARSIQGNGMQLFPFFGQSSLSGMTPPSETVTEQPPAFVLPIPDGGEIAPVHPAPSSYGGEISRPAPFAAIETGAISRPFINLVDVQETNKVDAYLNGLKLEIPIKYDITKKRMIQELQLYYSTDLGKTWSKGGVAKPDTDSSFPFNAPQDGLYWFQIAIIDYLGNRNPPTFTSPAFRVMIDTKPPVVTIKSLDRVGNDATVSWEIQEPNPDWSKFQIDYQVGDSNWIAVSNAKGAFGGRTQFPIGQPGTARVRILAYDLAGNRTEMTRDSVDAGKEIGVSDKKIAKNVLQKAFMPSPVPTDEAEIPLIAKATNVLPVAATVPGMPSTVKVTVANVRKQSAQLFEIAGDGKSTFVQKIPAGEAVDVKLTSGRQYVAVFIDMPDAAPTLESYTPESAGKVWLLR
jgi:hypothetical protein